MSFIINMTKRRRGRGSWEGGDLEKENSSVLDMPNYGCERNSQIEMCYWRVAGTMIQIWETPARVTVKATVMDSITLGKYVASGQ